MVRWPNVLDKSLLMFQVVVVALDVGFGTYDIYFHRYFGAAWSFGGAGFLLLVMVWMWRSRGKLAAARAEMEQHHELLRRVMEGIRMTTDAPDALSKAQTNLHRVMRQTDAKLVVHPQWGHRMRMVVGEDVFLINDNYIANERRGMETCYQVPTTMPDDEKVATAMLLLRNNPKLWDRWKQFAGTDTWDA